MVRRRPNFALLLEMLCPTPPLHVDGVEREAQYVDMENFANSDFTPLAVWLDNIRTRHPDHPRLPALVEFLEVPWPAGPVYSLRRLTHGDALFRLFHLL